jgi:c(7)-type cytochrome triheme protein
MRLPADKVFKTAPQSPDPVIFRHTTHVALVDRQCLTCHPTPFKMLQSAYKGNHATMDAGQGCGRCHDGKKAFTTKDGDCTACHGGTPAADPMLQALTLAHSKDAPGRVAFQHARHVSSKQTCSTCHTRLFATQPAKTPRAADAMHGVAGCGACHDGKRAFAYDEDCSRCHREEVTR